MENEELTNAWSAFNQNMENIEKMNKQILKKMISRRLLFRMQILKFQGILHILIIPLVSVLVIIPLIMNSEMTPYVLIGTILIVGVLIFGFIQGIIYYKLLNGIKPAFDPVIKTQQRILTLKKFMLKLQKNRNILYPVVAGAFILILWDKMHYELSIKIAVLALTTVAIYFWGNLKYKLYFQDRMSSIELEINELKEYQ